MNSLAVIHGCYSPAAVEKMQDRGDNSTKLVVVTEMRKLTLFTKLKFSQLIVAILVKVACGGEDLRERKRFVISESDLRAVTSQ